MTRLSFIVISCHVGSTKTTLICVGHCCKKALHILTVSDKFYRDKIGLCPFFKKKIQHFTPFPKLICEMPLIGNTIFSKSSFIKKRKEKLWSPIVAFYGANVTF